MDKSIQAVEILIDLSSHRNIHKAMRAFGRKEDDMALLSILSEFVEVWDATEEDGIDALLDRTVESII